MGAGEPGRVEQGSGERGHFDAIVSYGMEIIAKRTSKVYMYRIAEIDHNFNGSRTNFWIPF